MKNAQKSRTLRHLPTILLPVLGFALLAAVLMLRGAGGAPTAAATRNEAGDLVIDLADITSTASFYPVEVDGISLEVLAVRATDGTVRTAFNTCQVCYDSGRGFYVQQGEHLVCQNCGNRFHIDDVELMRGGCNPVPITEDIKYVEDDKVTVPVDILEQASVIFTEWRH